MFDLNKTMSKKSRKRSVFVDILNGSSVLIALLSLLCFVNVSAQEQSTDVELLVASRTDLLRFKPNSATRKPLFSDLPNRNTSILDVDYHLARNLVFWIDASTSRVHSKNLDDNLHDDARNEIVLERKGEWEPVALAVDFLSDKLYVVDVLGRKIEACDLGGGKRAIVVAAGLDRPTGIALDTQAGLMFVVDNDRITRMNMDGSSQMPIIRKSVESSISALTLDSTAKKIFWWDSDLRAIESSSYIGDSQRVVHRTADGEALTSLGFFDRHLYYLEKSSRSLFRVDGSSSDHNSKAEKILENVEGTSLRVVHASLQIRTTDSACNSAGCQHLCLLRGQSGSSCFCPEGQTLTADGKSCERLDEFLLYSQKEVIKGRGFEPGTAGVVMSIAARRSLGLSIDFDYERRSIYFADANTKKIYRTEIETGEREAIASYEGSASLSVDWAAQILYYSDFVAGTLCVVSLRNASNHKCLLDSLTGPRNVMAHPRRGQVYFYDDDRIKRINADGSKLTILHTPVAHKVLALALDHSADRLYWLQTAPERPGHVTVHNSNLDGADVHSVEAPLLRDCSALALRADWIYAVCDSYERLLRLNKRTGKQLAELATGPDGRGFYALAVFAPQISNQQQQPPRHPCAVNNGGCSKLCFAVPWSKNRPSQESLMRVCACPAGERLGRRASSERREGTDCLSEVAIKPQHLVHRCEPDWEYTCRNGRCVPRSQLCDGVNDCLDRSDERDCPNYRNYFIGGR